MLAGSSSLLAKKDVATIVKTIKSHSKNASFCREAVLILQAKLFEKEGGRAARKLFALNKTGGISVLLHSIEHNVADTSYVELALSLLCSLTNAASRGRSRICAKVAKKGGSKVLITVISTHQKQPKILVAALSILVPLAACDRKISNLCRSTGALNSLIAILKTPNIPKELLVTALSAMNALSKSEYNVNQLGRKGAIPLLVEICQRFISKPAPVGLKYALKSIINLCRIGRNVSEFVKESGVMAMFGLLREQKESIDVQKLAVDVLKCFVADEDGRIQFITAGGSAALIGIMERNNAEKNDEQLLEIVLHLLKFHDLTELPIVSEEEVTWSIDAALERRRSSTIEVFMNSGASFSDEFRSGEFGENDPAASNDESDQAVAAEMQQFSPELDPAFLKALRERLLGKPLELSRGRQSSTQLATPQQAQHVRPFTAPRPSPSCSSSLQYVPDFVEEFYQPAPTLKLDIVRRALHRLTHPEQLLHDVVYDDVPRSRGPGPRPPSSSHSSSQAPVPCSTPALRFSSHFESGNLKRAIRVYDTEYDLIINTDVNSQVHALWFYFSVEGAVPGVAYRFNLINMEKDQSQYGDGQRPLLFSEKQFMSSGVGWVRAGYDIAYMRNAYVRRLKREGKADCSNYFTLHFAWDAKHSQDRVYLAYCYPYTYTDLQNYLRGLPEQQVAEYFVNQEFCRTLDNNLCNLLTITTLNEEGCPPIRERKVIVCSGRVHPGESAASWMVKGLIDFLLDPADPAAKHLRDNFVWKIVPMLNPDGVINGNHRCSLTGHDLNREWIAPDRHLYPEIWYLKHYLKSLKQLEGRTVLMYTDFHGHSKRRNIFMYGCSAKPKKPETSASPLSGFERLFPRLLSEVAPFFVFDHCGFKVQKGHGSTGRVVAWRQVGLRLSYTLEASLCGGDNVCYSRSPTAESVSELHKYVDPAAQQAGHFNTGHYAAMGALFCKAIRLFCNMELEDGRKLADVLRYWCDANGTDAAGDKDALSSDAADDAGDTSDAVFFSSEADCSLHKSKPRTARRRAREGKGPRSKSANGRCPGPPARRGPAGKAVPLAAIPVTISPVPGSSAPLLAQRSAFGHGRYAVPPPPPVLELAPAGRPPALTRASQRLFGEALKMAHLYEEDQRSPKDEDEDGYSDDEADDEEEEDDEDEEGDDDSGAEGTD